MKIINFVLEYGSKEGASVKASGIYIRRLRYNPDHVPTRFL